jgi:predicted NAD/FAD-binding protein
MSEIVIPAAQIFLSLALMLVAILCFRLDAKLNALRKGKDGVAAAAGQLNAAVNRADAAIKALRAHSEEASELLQKRIDEAQAISDGLKFQATTARALEPRALEPRAYEPRAREIAPAREPSWEDQDFVPARREPTSASRWGGLR